MASAAQIRTKAIKRLGLISLGQTPRSEMAADFDDAYAEVYAALESLDIVTWDFDEEVPDEFVHSVVTLVAYNRVDEYRVANDRYQRLSADVSGAIPAIRALQASNVYDQPTAEYF